MLNFLNRELLQKMKPHRTPFPFDLTDLNNPRRGGPLIMVLQLNGFLMGLEQHRLRQFFRRHFVHDGLPVGIAGRLPNFKARLIEMMRRT